MLGAKARGSKRAVKGMELFQRDKSGLTSCRRGWGRTWVLRTGAGEQKQTVSAVRRSSLEGVGEELLGSHCQDPSWEWRVCPPCPVEKDLQTYQLVRPDPLGL